MRNKNAQIVLCVRKLTHDLLCFRSELSGEILLIVTSSSGTIELRQLFKLIRMTPAAVRQNVQLLINDDYLELRQHPTNRRCKIVCLTDRAWAVMRKYEQEVQKCLSGWSKVA